MKPYLFATAFLAVLALVGFAIYRGHNIKLKVKALGAGVSLEAEKPPADAPPR